MIRLIHATHLDAYWDKVLPLLEPAIEAGRRAKPDEVLKWLQRGDYQLWVCGDATEILAAATTAVTVYPGSKWLTVVHCGGRDMPRWLEDGLDTLERWAVGAGCDGVEIVGRPEWGRVLDGYEVSGTMTQKFLMPERRAAQ